MPFFLVDSPPSNVKGWKEAFVAQIQDFIEWAEKLTGRRYDDEKLIEATKNEWESMATFAKVCELTQATPTPLDARHTQSLRMPTVAIRPEKKCVDYCHMLLDETKERVKDGISARGYEGIRLQGSIGNFFNQRLNRFPESYGAITIPGPVGAFAVWSTHEDGTWYVPKTPMERNIQIRTREDALAAEAELWQGGRAAGGIESTALRILLGVVPQIDVQEVKQWHIDAVISPIWRSMEAACQNGTLERVLAVRNMGVPVMAYENSLCDPRFYDEARVREQAITFFESLGMKRIFD